MVSINKCRLVDSSILGCLLFAMALPRIKLNWFEKYRKLDLILFNEASNLFSDGLIFLEQTLLDYCKSCERFCRKWRSRKFTAQGITAWYDSRYSPLYHSPAAVSVHSQNILKSWRCLTYSCPSSEIFVDLSLRNLFIPVIQNKEMYI